MTRQLTAAEFKAINSQKKIKGKRLRRKAIEKGVAKERKQDPREVNYYECALVSAEAARFAWKPYKEASRHK